MLIKKIILPVILLVSIVSFGQQSAPKRGPRKPLNLENIADASFYPGKILIKIKPGFENYLQAKIPKTKDGNFKFGMAPLDEVNKQLKVTGLQRSFEGVLKNSLKNAQHKAWGFDRWYTIDVPAKTNIKAAIAKLKALSGIIEEAEPSFKRVLYDNDDPILLWTPSDSAYFRQWNYNHTAQEGPTSPAGTDADIDLPEAWDLEKGNPDVIVALMDGGVDTSHPDLLPNLWRGTGNEHFGFNWFTNTNVLETNAHGTHTCGTIAAVNNNTIGVSGIAGGDGTPNSGVKVMNMQIFNTTGSTYAGDEATANAFIYSADRGAAISQNSWGGGDASVIISDAIDYFIMNGGGAVLNGGIVIFSAGNSGNEVQSFPGNYPPVICVGATNYDDKRSWYSTYGSWIDIMAPGGELNINGGATINGGRKGILSTVPASTGALYGWNQGTSMACPHVSGVAALCVSKVPGKLSNDQLRTIILESTDNIYPLNPTYIGKLGSGRINALLAVKNAALAVGVFVDSATAFKAKQACGSVQLTWQKNTANNNVIIAESDSLLFGTPSGTLNQNDKLPGGGIIIYTGNAGSLTRQIAANKRKYYRIWSYSGSNYSFHETVTVIYPLEISVPVLTNKSGCVIRISWTDVLTCPGDSVLLLANSRIPFDKPAGILKVGDTTGGGAVVIYKGKKSLYDYTTKFDSTVYIQKWNFNAAHDYTNAGEGNYDFVNKPNSVKSLTANGISGTSININWGAAAGDCFGGDQYLLAYSSNETFGNPTGVYEPGSAIAGGGEVLYIGTDLSFSHTNLNPNTSYCYRIWKIRNAYEYSSGKQVCSRTLCSNSLITIPYNYGFNGDNVSDPDICLWDVVNETDQANALKVVTAAANPNASPVEGSGMLRFNSYNVSSGESATLVSRSIKKGSGKSMDLRFRWYQDSSSYTSDAYSREGVKVQWSTDRASWQDLEFYPRVPVEGATGWSYKQISLPAAALPYDTVYLAFVFTSGFGNNCFLDDLRLKLSTYKPSDGTVKMAVCESTDSTSLWTNYYDATGDRLISIKKNDQSIGKAGQAGFSIKVGGTATSVLIPASANYVSNPGGWLTMKRYYSFNPLTEPTGNINLRFYFFTNDLNGLTSAAASLLTPLRTDLTYADLYAWKINNVSNTYDPDPATGHPSVPAADNYKTNGYTQYVNTPLADTATWQYSSLGSNVHSMEYIIARSGGGGLGIGSTNGRGALLLVDYTFTGAGNWTNAANWLGSNKPPAILPANGRIIIDGSGECILNTKQTVPAGGELIVNPGKKLKINSDLGVKQ